jgi:hypothetical protein
MKHSKGMKLLIDGKLVDLPFITTKEAKMILRRGIANNGHKVRVVK